MGKRWIMLLVIALTVILATTAYAEPKMVIVLDPTNPGSVTCYRVDRINQHTMVGLNQCDEFPQSGHEVVDNPPPRRINIKDQHSPTNNNTTFRDHPLIANITNPAGGSIVWSNPCVTYRIGGRSYTVCD
jgi:hypothetical protein